MRKTLLMWVAGLVIAGCGSSAGGAEEPMPDEPTVGGDLSAYAGPIASTDVDHGKDVFDTLCGDCHPGGEDDVGPSLIEDPHSPARIRQQVREGSGKMRPFGENRLSDDDLEAVLAYLASIHAVK